MHPLRIKYWEGIPGLVGSGESRTGQRLRVSCNIPELAEKGASTEALASLFLPNLSPMYHEEE